jgi:hypothetical protein
MNIAGDDLVASNLPRIKFMTPDNAQGFLDFRMLPICHSNCLTCYSRLQFDSAWSGERQGASRRQSLAINGG